MLPKSILLDCQKKVMILEIHFIRCPKSNATENIFQYMYVQNVMLLKIYYFSCPKSNATENTYHCH